MEPVLEILFGLAIASAALWVIDEIEFSIKRRKMWGGRVTGSEHVDVEHEEI